VNFNEAVEHVRKTKESLYTFIPERKIFRGKLRIVGGVIYYIRWNSDFINSEEDENIYIDCLNGLFGDEAGFDSYEESYYIDDQRLGEVKNLFFYHAKGGFEYGYMIEYCLFKIAGEDTSIFDTFDNKYQMIRYLNSQSFIKKFDRYRLRVPYAIDKKGQIHSPATADKSNNYFCPGCNEIVIYKHGEVYTPHFSHKGKDVCNLDVIIREIAKKLILKTVQEWKEGSGNRPIILRSCQICGEISKSPLPEKVDKAILNYSEKDDISADVALLVENKAQAFIQIKKHGDDFKKDDNKYLLPYIVVEGEDILKNSLIWKPVIDKFNQFTCSKCKESDVEYQNKIRQISLSAKLTIPKEYYRYAITECINCFKEIIVFAWPKMQEYNFFEPILKPIPPTVKYKEIVEYRASGTFRDSFWANVCPHCRDIQEAGYLFREPDGPFFSIKLEDSTEGYKNDMNKIKSNFFEKPINFKVINGYK